MRPASTSGGGLYVAAADARGFEVRELQAGTASLAFDWRVVAERKGAPAGSRLTRAPDPRVAEVLERLPGPPADRPPVETVPPPAVPPVGPGRRGSPPRRDARWSTRRLDSRG